MSSFPTLQNIVKTGDEPMTDLREVYAEKIRERDEMIKNFMKWEVEEGWKDKKEREDYLEDISNATIWIKTTNTIFDDIKNMEEIREWYRNKYPEGLVA